MMNDETLGRAKMRGISAVIFGSPEALRRVHQLAHEHELGTVLMPASADVLDEALRTAVRDAAC
jgi:hypothetical protein